jgi:acylphosphatase
VVRNRVFVSGWVQGVFYRESCRREAQRRGVAGSVRNLPDGRVEAVFEGPDDAVAAMVAWAGTGPGGAHVDSVEVVREPPTGLRGFDVAG